MPRLPLTATAAIGAGLSDGKVSVTGWTGSGKAGVAKFGNSTWNPFLPDTDNYFVFIQMTKGFADGASYIEQTVTPEATGLYAFTCQYATRWTYNPNAMRLGFSVVCGNVTNELEEAALLAGDSRFRNAMRYVTLEAGRSYTFRLYGVAESGTADVDRTAIIGSCSLELLPAADRTISSDYHLTTDEDWSAQSVAIAAGVKVHLDGHTLKIGYVRPDGNGDAPEFTDETQTPGVLCATLPTRRRTRSIPPATRRFPKPPPPPAQEHPKNFAPSGNCQNWHLTAVIGQW